MTRVIAVVVPVLRKVQLPPASRKAPVPPVIANGLSLEIDRDPDGF